MPGQDFVGDMSPGMPAWYAERMPLVKKLVALMDVDQDGTVTDAELCRYWSAVTGRTISRPDEIEDKAVADLSGQSIEQMEAMMVLRNDPTMLQAQLDILTGTGPPQAGKAGGYGARVSLAAELLGLMDADKDGSVSDWELCLYHSAVTGRTIRSLADVEDKSLVELVGRSTESFLEVLVARNDEPTLRRHIALMKTPKPMATKCVSAQYAALVDQLLDLIDADGDGYLSEAELCLYYSAVSERTINSATEIDNPQIRGLMGHTVDYFRQTLLWQEDPMLASHVETMQNIKDAPPGMPAWYGKRVPLVKQLLALMDLDQDGTVTDSELCRYWSAVTGRTISHVYDIEDNQVAELSGKTMSEMEQMMVLRNDPAMLKDQLVKLKKSHPAPAGMPSWYGERVPLVRELLELMDTDKDGTVSDSELCQYWSCVTGRRINSIDEIDDPIARALEGGSMDEFSKMMILRNDPETLQKHIDLLKSTTKYYTKYEAKYMPAVDEQLMGIQNNQLTITMAEHNRIVGGLRTRLQDLEKKNARLTAQLKEASIGSAIVSC